MSVSGRAVDTRPGDAFLLVEEICHRVTNEYAQLIASLTAAAQDTHDVVGRRALVRAADTLHDYAAAHHALRAPPSGQRDLADYLEGVCLALSVARLRPRGVKLSLSADAVDLSASRCWRVGLVISELICNSLRHGFTERAGDLHICLRHADGQILCRVSGEGAGLDLFAPGNGRRIIRRLAQELGGSIGWSAGSCGVSVNLVFPAAEPRSDRNVVGERFDHGADLQWL